MHDKTLTDHLDFLIALGGQDEATVLAQALRIGVEAMYQEALVGAYLLGRVTRETTLRDLGAERLAEIEYQRVCSGGISNGSEGCLKPSPTLGRFYIFKKWVD